VNKLFNLYVLLFCASFLSAQLKPKLIWPIDSPRVLTGNFGELRPNHFHTGIDFSTNGKENLHVYAIEDGYVSRIRASSVGYGKAIYITHANGRVSVYAHLNSFSLKIDKFLKEEQYAKRSYEVDFYPQPWSIYVRKNEIIGLSGNTGGSSGPHLHFEWRDEKTEVTINPLTVYHVDDKISPVIQQISFYDLSDTLQPDFFSTINIINADYSKDTVELPGSIFGLAFAGFDQYLKNGNHNNVYAAKLFVDNELIYHHELSTMDFADFRYVNEFCDYRNHQKFQKCFLPGNYPAYIYPYVKNKGRIILNDNKAHAIRLELTDESGNLSQTNFYLRAKLISIYKSQNMKCDAFVFCNSDTIITTPHIQMHFPFQCLYNNLALYLNFSSNGLFFSIQPSTPNLRSPVKIGIKIPDKFYQTKEQVVIKTGSGVIVPEISNDSLFFGIKNFGNYELMLDQVSPSVKTTLSSKKRRAKNVLSKLVFVISDNLSGVGTYALFVNEKWVIAEYDAKTHQLIYSFEDNSPKGTVQIKLVLKDRVGNLSEHQYSISR